MDLLRSSWGDREKSCVFRVLYCLYYLIMNLEVGNVKVNRTVTPLEAAENTAIRVSIEL